MRPALLASVCILGLMTFGLATTTVQAVDVPIAGRKLIVVDRITLAGQAKAVFMAKDPAVRKGSGTDPTQIEATLHVAYGSVSGTFMIPQGTGWLVNSRSLARYVNTIAPVGGAVKTSVIKPGSLVKVVGESLGDTPLDISSAPSGPVYVMDTIVNGGDETRLCTQFTGCVHKGIAGGTGYKLLCKGNSTGDAACTAALATTTTTSSTTSTTMSPLCSPGYSSSCGSDFGGLCLSFCGSGFTSGYCMEPQVFGSCITDDDCAAFPETSCLNLELYKAGCQGVCVAPYRNVDYTCTISDAPACGGTCPGGQVCGQAPGGNFCGCAPPDNTCSIAQAPTCGGTCPNGQVCGQAPGGNFCGCAPPDNTCSIAQAPTCGGTCPSGQDCGPMGDSGGGCQCVLHSCSGGSSSADIVVLEQGGPVPAGLIRIDPLTGSQCGLSGGGLLSNAIGENPNGVTLDPYSHKLLVVDRVGRIVAVDVTTGAQALVTSGLADPTAIAVESPGRFLITEYGGSLLRFDSTSHSLSVVASGGYIGGVAPFAVQMHQSGAAIISALTAGGNDVPGLPSRVIRVDPTSGAQTLIAEITDGQFRDFALTDTYAFIAISSRGYPAGADRVAKLDLATGELSTLMTGLQRVLDVDFASDQSLVILDQLLSLPCCPPWLPVVYSASQDGSMRQIVTQGGGMFAPGRLVVLP